MEDEKSTSKKKIGVSKNAPKSDARPLGTPAPRRSHSKKKQTGADQTVEQSAEKAVDNSDETPANSSSTQMTSANDITNGPSTTTGSDAHSQKEQNVMSKITLTLDPKTRKSTSVVFKLGDGIRGSVRIAKTAFPGGVPPSALTLQSDAENVFATPKAKLTAEQRKEARKNAPKLTPAQKLQKLNERAAKLQAKIDAQAAAAAPAVAAQA